MATVTPKMTVQQKLQATCPTHSRSDISVRDVETVIDEPVERDGTNLGLTPTETMIAALIGCTNVIGNKIAHKHGIEMRDVTIDAEATFDRRGTALSEEVEVPFPRIVLTVNVVTNVSPEDFAVVPRELQKFCPIAKVIRAAGTEIKEVWNVTQA
jgi:putative redox protein